MEKKLAFFSSFFFFFFFFFFILVLPNKSMATKTVVVCFDGFANYYFKLRPFALPWFHYFREIGTFTESIKSVFPTETFPNAYSIATGLYPESHGIVGNEMYDSVLGERFFMNTTDPVWWDQAEPLWITARRLGMKTAVFAWPGSTIEFGSDQMTANFYSGFDPIYPFRNRVDDAIKVMLEDDVDLVFLYHHQPASTGHGKGTRGASMAHELMRTDWLLSYLIMATERNQLGQDKLNLIICSDHGMYDRIKREIYLEDYIDIDSKLEGFTTSGGWAHIWPKPGLNDLVFMILKKAAKESKHWMVERRARMPDNYHHQWNMRIPPIIAMTSPGTFLGLARANNVPPYVGINGYSPEVPEMQPILMARGPEFKNAGFNATEATEGIETVDIYGLIAHAIGLDFKLLPENNVTLSKLTPMLNQSVRNESVHHVCVVFLLLLLSTINL